MERFNFLIFTTNSFFLIQYTLSLNSDGCFMSKKYECFICSIKRFYPFNNYSWTGEGIGFDGRDCVPMQKNSSMKIFISPKACLKKSLCNGSESHPFDNLIVAFKFCWRSGAGEIFLFSKLLNHDTMIFC